MQYYYNICNFLFIVVQSWSGSVFDGYSSLGSSVYNRYSYYIIVQDI